MIARLLVANRAEIAGRVFRTCRDLGIGTVAVHSDADAGLPYVAEADVAVRLPGVTPAETYLRADLVVEAALAAGADAVHPGYGFLSESADFARAVEAAGLTWVGPTPGSIEQMGSKVEAKKLMEAAGVPVLTNLDPSTVTESDLPVLVKASAGGGGRGMRVVRTLGQLADAVAGAEAEAASAFGDGTVFVETYVERGRHVEVQVVGTTVVGDRDCSLQRRHQKVVEEAPAPGLPDGVRAALHEAAESAAAAIDYRGAGTVEFLYDEASERFFFLEMNTRLQVEHPVTEAVHGVDLVAAQLAAAEGTPVAVATPARGHAIEVRLYAEDPAADYQPQSGLLTRFEVPAGDGVRVDAGFVSGTEVSTHYDAMLAKVVAHAPTREQAARRLAGVLSRARIHGLTTNRDQLLAVLRHPAFLAGEVSTAFLAEHDLDLGALPGTAVEQGLGLFAAAVAVTERAASLRPVQPGVPTGWRNVVSAPQTTSFEVAGTRVDVDWLGGRDGSTSADRHGEVDGARAVAVEGGPDDWVVTVDHAGRRRRFAVATAGDRVDVDSGAGHLALRLLPRFTDPADAVAEGSLLAPMPGTVVAVPVADGATVAAGDPVVVLEAMKMQHTIRAPGDGTVGDLAAVGTQVAAGDVLAVVSTGSTSDDEGEPA
ncbi:ATP-binding protein [Nocardioides marmoraquaticus]